MAPATPAAPATAAAPAFDLFGGSNPLAGAAAAAAVAQHPSRHPTNQQQQQQHPAADPVLLGGPPPRRSAWQQHLGGGPSHPGSIPSPPSPITHQLRGVQPPPPPPRSLALPGSQLAQQQAQQEGWGQQAQQYTQPSLFSGLLPADPASPLAGSGGGSTPAVLMSPQQQPSRLGPTAAAVGPSSPVVTLPGTLPRSLHYDSPQSSRLPPAPAPSPLAGPPPPAPQLGPLQLPPFGLGLGLGLGGLGSVQADLRQQQQQQQQSHQGSVGSMGAGSFGSGSGSGPLSFLGGAGRSSLDGVGLPGLGGGAPAAAGGGSGGGSMSGRLEGWDEMSQQLPFDLSAMLGPLVDQKHHRQQQQQQSPAKGDGPQPPGAAGLGPGSSLFDPAGGLGGGGLLGSHQQVGSLWY